MSNVVKEVAKSNISSWGKGFKTAIVLMVIVAIAFWWFGFRVKKIDTTGTVSEQTKKAITNTMEKAKEVVTDLKN